MFMFETACLYLKQQNSESTNVSKGFWSVLYYNTDKLNIF